VGAASGLVQARLAQWWPRIRDDLLSVIEWRTATRRSSLERALAQRQDAERRRVVTNLEQFAGTLRRALTDDEIEDALISLAEAAKSRDELVQYRRDRQSWQQRLAGLENERNRELAMIEDRYRDPQPHQFPVAVVFVVPRREATR
jgi:hypothetical protein